MASLALAFDILAKDKASKTLDTVGSSVDRTGRKVTGFGSKLSSMSGKAKAAFAGAAIAATAFAKSSIEAFVGAEESQAELARAFEKFPKLADSNIAAFRKLNEQLAKKTKFDDDATASGQAVLAQFKLTGKQITTLTPLLQDYAAKTGKDLPTAASDLGKAILGQGRALKAIGVDFKDTGTEAGNFEQLMAALNTQVGGFAENQGKTAAGQAAILTNRFGELQEKVGAVLVPVLLRLVQVIDENVLPKLRDAHQWAKENETAAKVLAGVVGGVLLAAMLAYAASAAAAAVATIAATWPIWVMVAAVAALVIGTQWLWDKFNLGPKVSKVFQFAIDSVTTAVEDLIAAVERAIKVMERLIELANRLPTDPIGALGGTRAKDLLGGESNVTAGAAAGAAGGLMGRRAGGGPIGPGRWLFGERGPEVADIGASGFVTPNHALGEEVHLHVTQLPGENQVDAGIRALRHHRRIQMQVAG